MRFLPEAGKYATSFATLAGHRLVVAWQQAFLIA